MSNLQIHGTCVAIQQCGVMLLGASGSGKSDLALRLIDRGAALVADDQLLLMTDGGILTVSAPQNIKGLIEIRGLGLMNMPSIDKVPVSLVVQLVKPEYVERMPHPEIQEFMGIGLPVLKLHAFEASAPLKVEAAFSARQNNSLKVGFLRE